MRGLKVIKRVVAVAAFIAAGMAQAGPSVTVVFKNSGSSPAVYSPIDSNEGLTRSFARSAPLNSVSAGATDKYVVQGRLSPDASHAFVRYRAGVKECKFKSTYIMAHTRGVRAPKWIKEAVASGGARCDARIVSVNSSTHEWTVEFVMR
ncbi:MULTISPECIES: hypothetical protein [Pseudomonas]|uniref:Uncharacterized protein n=1 Tax=Pseudomonas cichorii TaxID=36746 RepID=A0ABQ1DMN2_PSECI|nr:MULTISPECIES: hypothetical protein [Pseudomonas]QVE17582.1 hypothetical protein KGD89_02045 [Pseudomonas cichorii]GFM76491.1 hypothetical protein PSCICM_23100 [Pseudomonas cichorii]GFM92275.1 hypothetical protein PSCICP_22470 [Pseudomonas cichorii]